MYKIAHFSLLIFLFVACSDSQHQINLDEAAIFDTKIIEVYELEQLQFDVNMKILDLRPKEEYDLGHIGGALLVSREMMEDTTSAIQGTMATELQMENMLSSLGIKNTDYIVIYDGNGNPEACRLLWILDHYGHKNKAILNGGFMAWELGRKELSKNTKRFKRTNYSFNGTKSEHYASLIDMKLALKDTNYCIIDARSKDEYSGKELKGKVERSGHIPGSIHIDFEENINKNSFKLKSSTVLKKVYSTIPRNKNIIVYCHSGVRSALTTFVLSEILHYNNVKNYDGSWIEWSSIHDLPIEKMGI